MGAGVVKPHTKGGKHRLPLWHTMTPIIGVNPSNGGVEAPAAEPPTGGVF
tara:strand:- start:500 stop:649 length:150 start_codon:yes stop_codon:yes gene_type:complete